MNSLYMVQKSTVFECAEKKRLPLFQLRVADIIEYIIGLIENVIRNAFIAF